MVTLPHRQRTEITRGGQARSSAHREVPAMTSEFNDTIPGTTVARGLDKDDLIVITGAGGFIAGSLTRYFHEQGYTNIRAVDRKPLPDWYLRVPGVESISMDLSHEQNAIDAVKGAVGGLQPRGRHGRDGVHRELPRRMPAQHPRQHAPDRGVLSRRGAPLLLLVVGLRLQHRPPEVARGHRAQGDRTPTRPWPSAATAGRSSSPRCSARSTGPNAASRPTSPDSTTSTDPTEPGSVVGRRRRRRCAAR